MTDEDVLSLVLDVARSVNPQLGNRISIDQGAEAPVFGVEAALDSLGLVSFLVAVEEAVADRIGVNLILADERAMSQTQSPYRTIGTLVAYIRLLLADNA